MRIMKYLIWCLNTSVITEHDIKKYQKGIKGYLSGYVKCPRCGYYAFEDKAGDDYWICNVCGYKEDRIYGLV